MLILGWPGTYHTHRVGVKRSKGQKIYLIEYWCWKHEIWPECVFLLWKNESVIKNSLLPLSGPKSSKMMFLEANFTNFFFKYPWTNFFSLLFYLVLGWEFEKQVSNWKPRHSLEIKLTSKFSKSKVIFRPIFR